MSKDTDTLTSIAARREKLAAELARLEHREAELREEQTAAAFEEVVERLKAFAPRFSAKQRAEIAALLGGVARAPKAATKHEPRRAVPPKYWLPHSQETWTGRGRTPRAFVAWQETAAYKEWKARHPDEKFPKFPG